MTEEDDWVKLALNDDTVVVQLLMKLKQALSSSSPPPPPPTLQPPVLQVDWSVRQRRSKQVSKKKDKAAVHDSATRASPTTPLSWSCGTTSISGGGGFEESSLPAKAIDTERSKVAVTSETPTIKRSRKKKTLPELKEEESLLLKERRNLKHQLASLRFTVENQRALNENLKRLKVDLISRQMPETVAVAADDFNSNNLKQIKLPCDPTCSTKQINAVCNKLETSSSSAAFQIQEVVGRECSYVLPDLNLPVEDNSGTDVLYRIS